MARSRLPLTAGRGRARGRAGAFPRPWRRGRARKGSSRHLPHFPGCRAERQRGQWAPCCSSCLVLLLATWLGCIWLRTMIFLTLQRSWKILRRMWKPRRNLLTTSPEREMFPRSTLCVHQGCNLPFRQQRSSRGLAWEVAPLLVS